MSHYSPSSHKPEEVASVSSYRDYPAQKPFINTDYRRDPSKPIDSYPENNRDAVMNALKGLQDKIRQLELERSQAENNLRNMTTETATFRDSLRGAKHSERVEQNLTNVSTGVDDVSPGDLTQENTEIKTKLDSAEGRCNVLEKQLEYMRRMVQNSEQDRSEALRKAALLQHQQADLEEKDLRSHLNKIADLEREHLKLTATQTLAENKIRTLEGQLREEKHHRRMMQDRAAELETAAQTNRILLEANKERPVVKKVRSKKRKPVKSSKVNNGTKSVARKKVGMEPPEHYRLNLGDLPFIAGQSTSPSHSIAANFQEVLSLMKSHNTKLCKSPRQHAKSGHRVLATKGSTSSSGLSSGSSQAELSDLLLQLQDEFGHLSFEHQELSRQIQQCTDPRLREDLERELDSVVGKMEAKGEQIGRLRRHQDMLASGKTTKKCRSRPTSARPTSAHASMPTDKSGEIQVTTTIKTRPHSAQDKQGGRGQASLSLLKDLKKIQTTLRKDDISWE